MTTVPTRIALVNKSKSQKLSLTEGTVKSLHDSVNGLRDEIRVIGHESAEEKISRYPHLTELLNKINGDIDFLFSSEYITTPNIKSILTAINDLPRITNRIKPELNPLQQEDFRLPTITTPYWNMISGDHDNKMGRLVIIDTPGPNEAGEGLGLSGIVEQQIRTSSMVLIVLDFSQLYGCAAQEIKRKVQPFIELIGNENLYILVNKVDLRTEDDPMTPEKVMDFVRADLGISNQKNEAYVFEVAARWALCAAEFLSELHKDPSLTKDEMKTARALAEQVFGIDWEEDFEDSTLEILEKKARRLWKKSGFEPFLKNAINLLIANAAPRSINSAIKLAKAHLKSLNENCTLRKSAIMVDKNKLDEAIKLLEEDLTILDNCRKRIQAVENTRKHLKNNLSSLLKDLLQLSKVETDEFFSKKDFDSQNIVRQIDIGARNLLLTPISDMKLFPDWLSDAIFNKLQYNDYKELEFESLKEAEDFSNAAILYSKNKSSTYLCQARQRTKSEISKARKELVDFLEAETRPIIKRAYKRLNEAFDVKLTIPDIKISDDDQLIEVVPQVQKNSRFVSGGTETITKKKRVWYHWFFLVPKEIETQISLPDVEKKYFTVSMETLIQQINSSIENNIQAINFGLDEYIDGDFQYKINQYFSELDLYFSSYRRSLQQAQKDQKLESKAKEDLVSNLDILIRDSIKKKSKCDRYENFIKPLVQI